MAIHLTATIYEATLVELLGQLFPLTVKIDEKRARFLQVEKPAHVGFVKGEGLRIHTSAEVQWSVAGLPLRFVLRRLSAMIRPVIVEDALGGKLVFKVELEDVDLKGVPAAIDHSLVATVNGRLAAMGDKLGWDFGKTLRRTIPLPPSMDPVEAFQLRAQEGEVVVESDHLRFSFYAPSRFRRVDPKTKVAKDARDAKSPIKDARSQTKPPAATAPATKNKPKVKPES